MSAPKLDPVLITRDGGIAIITIQNPPFNVLTTPVVDALADAVVGLTQDPEVRCIVITGSGDKAFSSGANVREMATMGILEASRYSAKGQALTNLIERAPIPVIAAVRGFCLGGGCELSLSCDFIVAAEDAVFAQPEINIGVIPGWGGSRRLTRAIGVARARHWIFTGEKVPAQKAYEDGLVDIVVSPKKLMDESLALARMLSSKGALAMAAAKYAVNQASDATRLLGLEFERDLWGILFNSQDQKEGMNAFLEKRPPNFRDRVDWAKMMSGAPWKVEKRVFDSARRDAKLEVRSREGSRPFYRYPQGGTEVLSKMFDLSANNLHNYQRLMAESWRLTLAPYLSSSGKRTSLKT
jgi:enoyl-CoA hydratase